jgi:hypothetical protein
MMPRRELRATLPIALLALFVGATCGEESTPTPPDRIPGGSRLAGSVVRDGIEYGAEVLVMESFPVQLSGRVTVRNTSSEARTVTFPDGCVALLRAYRVDGGGPVWDQAGGLGCTMALVPVALGSGEEREIQTPTATAYDVLGSELPDGEYRIAVYLRPIGVAEVEVVAGTTDLAIPR